MRPQVSGHGRVAEDATIEKFDNGKSVIDVVIACNFYQKPQDGEENKEDVQYHKLSIWNRADLVNHLKKKTLIGFTGELSYNLMGIQDEKQVKMYQILVNKLDLLGSGKKSQDGEIKQS